MVRYRSLIQDTVELVMTLVVFVLVVALIGPLYQQGCR